MNEKRSKDDVIKELTWPDIHEWAGAGVGSRGRSYQRNHRVQELARSPVGGLVAWVQGTEKYSTFVDVKKGGLTSACTCPYAGTCKHAVAVVLEFLERSREGNEVPTVTDQDERLSRIQGTFQAGTPDAGTEDADVRRSAKAGPDSLRTYLEGHSKAQLVSLIDEPGERYPVVREALEDRRDLSAGSVSRLVRSVREEIDRLSAEPGWTDSWSGESYVPDYSRVRDRLEALLAGGRADEVVGLGEELLDAGNRQVEMSHDEGETATEIAGCMNVVFRALPRSSLSPADQLLWALEAELADDYGIYEGTAALWELKRAPGDWNTVAETLMRRLDEFGPASDEDGLSTHYRRDRISDWAIVALQNAGRAEEVIPLCEREAQETGSYVRLVGHLRAVNRLDEAAQWVGRGFVATQQQWPGIASQLRDCLREMREEEDDWLTVAALRADELFEKPSVSRFTQLRNAAQRADVWTQVRPGAMHYLETGELPQVTGIATESEALPPWPLPDTGLAKDGARRPRKYPDAETLIAIAIAEDRPDDVLHWYDRLGPPTGWGWGGSLEERVAEAVVDTHPDRAVAIWKGLSEREIALTQTSAYQVAEGHLRKARRVLRELGREEEWRTYLAELRQRNVRKRRLVEILDGLAGRPIIEGP